MTKRAVTIGLLLALAGCLGTGPRRQPSHEEPMVEFIPPMTVAPGQEPDHIVEATQVGQTSPTTTEDGPRPEPPELPGDAPPGPNEPDTPKPPERIDITELAHLLNVSGAEPNLTARAAPEPRDFNRTTVAEEAQEPVQLEPEAATDEGDPIESDSSPVNDDEPHVPAPFYQEYAEILQEYVQTDGRVDYTPLRRRRLTLKHLLTEPDELDPNAYRTWSKDDKLAFWINTYNLKMLDVIARNYPIESSMWLRLTWPPSDIRHIKGIWSDYRFIVMDEEFTLSEVERRIFRRTFGDPRVYLAITYASRSGPPLRRRPYRGEELDRQLDEQVKGFLANEKAFKIDRHEGIVYLSALFKPTWRGKEFLGQYATDKKFKSHGPETRAVLSFLTRYLSADDVYFLEVENYTLKYMNFDWRLNDTSKGY